eukprot:jgi/Chrzof1/5300/Cz15g21110.t1
MQVYNFCLLGFVLIGYLWPNLQLNTKSNPLFKHIQIDLYDPLRIQHESLPHIKPSHSAVASRHSAAMYEHSVQAGHVNSQTLGTA